MFRDHREKFGARIGSFEQLENRRLLAACPLPTATTNSSTATSAVVGSATAGAKAATATAATAAAKVAAATTTSAATTAAATTGATQQSAARFGGPLQGPVFAPGGGHSRFSAASQTAASQGTVLTAEATDAVTGATASIRYQTCSNGATTSTQLFVSVSKAPASSTLAVTVDGVAVGTITTDADGAGMLTLSSNAKTGVPTLPADFPSTVAVGSTVTVGDALTGTLESATTTIGASGPHGHRGQFGQGAGLRASLTDATTGATATVVYQTCTAGGATNARFGVLVTKGAANTTLDVSIDGVVFGSITTDANGSGSLLLASNPRKGEASLPATFPTTVAAGSTISVGTLSGTLAASGTTSAASATVASAAAKLARK